jgi:D-xylose transport system ATP-binding protein
VADTISVMYLGQLAAQVRTKDVTSNQVVELITTSRSGSMGLQVPDEPVAAAPDIDAALSPSATASREDTP